MDHRQQLLSLLLFWPKIVCLCFMFYPSRVFLAKVAQFVPLFGSLFLNYLSNNFNHVELWSDL